MSLRAAFFIDAPHRLGGSQRSLLAALERISEHGVEPLVFFPAEGPCVERYRSSGIRCFVEPAPAALLEFGGRLLRASLPRRLAVLARDVLPYSRLVGRRYREEGVEVAHFNTPRGILSVGPGVRLSGFPVVLHVRGAPPFGQTFWLPAQAMADRILLVARALVPHLAPWFRGRARVVYNGVDPPERVDRGAAREDLLRLAGFAPGDAPIFVSLSALVPFKGLHHLLRAAAQARDDGLRARYVLAGSSDVRSYAAWLVRLRRELDLDDTVAFVGQVPEPLRLLQGADALVLPTVDREDVLLEDGTLLRARSNEGLPRSVLEAMSAGLPVIASRVAGVGEQVQHGVTGLLVAPGDDAELAAALRRMAGDHELRAMAGEEALRLVRSHFTVGAAASGLADALLEARQAHRRGPSVP